MREGTAAGDRDSARRRVEKGRGNEAEVAAMTGRKVPLCTVFKRLKSPKGMRKIPFQREFRNTTRSALSCFDSPMLKR